MHQEKGQSPEGGGMLRELFSRTDLGTGEKKSIRRRKGRGNHLDRILRRTVAGNKHLKKKKKKYQVREI